PGSSTSPPFNVTVNSSGGNPPPPPPLACNGVSVGQSASLNGFLPFPADNLWNQNIANATVDPNSAAIINFIGTTDPVHRDSLHRGGRIKSASGHKFHCFRRRERSRPHACSRERACRRLSESW